jgi:hypothetical protein
MAFVLVLVVVLVLESLGAGSVGVLEYWSIEFTANSAFMALIYEMTIADVHDTITARSQVLVMGYYHQSFLFLTDQSSQKLHDGFSVRCIEVAGWFISKHNGRIVNQGSCNSDPLLFTSGKLVGQMMHPIG